MKCPFVILFILLPALVLGLAGCETIPSSPLLDVKSAKLLATVKRLADYGHLDESAMVQAILGMTLSETERVISGASVEDCRDHPTRIVTNRISTYTPSTDGFWFVRDPTLPPDRFQPAIDYSVDRLTLCGGQHSEASPEIVVNMTFRNISPYVCLSVYDLNVAIPHLLKSVALDSFQDIFEYRSPRKGVLVSFTYQYRAKCLDSITFEQSERARRIRLEPFWQWS